MLFFPGSDMFLFRSLALFFLFLQFRFENVAVQRGKELHEFLPPSLVLVQNYVAIDISKLRVKFKPFKRYCLLRLLHKGFLNKNGTFQQYGQSKGIAWPRV